MPTHLFSVTILCGLFAAGCGPGRGGPATVPVDDLVGTTWQLVEFRSSDDRIGIVTPADASAYTMALEPDSRVTLRLNCNRGSGTWTATPGGDASGSFEFGPVAMTKVFCPPPSLDTQIARDAEYVRSYVLRDGRLYLSLMADVGIYEWKATRDSR